MFHVEGGREGFLQVLLAPQTKLRGRRTSVRVEEHVNNGGQRMDAAMTAVLSELDNTLLLEKKKSWAHHPAG